MDFEAAKAHCKARNWLWSLDLIEAMEIEVETLKSENEKLKSQQKAHRLYNSCNF